MTRTLAATGVTLLALLACDGSGTSASVEAIPREQARRLYEDRCAICHGVTGDGHGLRRGSLHARPPDFRQAAWRRDATLSSVQGAIREGRPGTDMPAWRTLSESEIAGLAAYVLRFGEPASAIGEAGEHAGSVGAD